MSIQTINSLKVPLPKGTPLVSAKKYNGLVFVSGCIPIDSQTS